MVSRLFLITVFIFLWAFRADAQKLNTDDKTQNAGKVEWINRQLDTGTVPFGSPVSRDFQFKNISTEDLIILEVRSTCYCTVAEWPQTSIKPGETAVIRLTYDGQREGEFYRLVFVRTNFDSAASVVMALNGKVDKKKE
jgi:hypothetical protein